MSQTGYLAVIKAEKRYRKPGDLHPKKNVLIRNFSTSCPFDKLVTDVTEYKVAMKKIYISAVNDLHTGMLEGLQLKIIKLENLYENLLKTY